MKHQWLKKGDLVACANGCGVVVYPWDRSMVTLSVSELTAECPSTIEGELLTIETLTMIDDDLWVNPTHVHGAKVWQGIEHEGLGDENMSVVGRVVRNDRWTRLMLGRRDFEVHKPLYEVVALINGSA